MDSFVFNDTPLNNLYLGRNTIYRIDSYGNTYSPFANNKALTKVEIGYLVTSLENSLFEGCSALSSITLSSKLKRIGSAAFSGCTSLSSIEIPNNVSEIGSSAFSGCTMLESIEIPSSVESIGSYCFSGCTSLNYFHIEDSEQKLDLDTKYDALFSNCPLKDVYIGRNLSYGVYSPWRNSKINKIGIGSKVSVLGGSIFERCSSIESVTIFDCETPLSISGNTSLFKDCSLNEIYLGRDLSYSSTTSPLKDQKDLSKVTFGDKVTIIGNSAFWGCNSLDSIALPNSISIIGSYAFSNCTSLTQIDIPSTTIEIGENAFYGCSTLNSVNFIESDSTLTLLGKESIFKDCPLEKIILGRNIEYQNNSPFVKQAKLSDVQIGDKVTILGNYLFRNCTAFNSMVIPNSVKKIGEGAFSNCSSLKLIDIPKGIVEIEESTFQNCTSLTSIKIPNSVTEIGGSAFEGCISLNSIEIPNSVTQIGESAYAECHSLSIIDFIDGDISLTIVGNNPLFYNCPINEVYIGRNLSYFYPPFAEQQNLAKVTLGNSVNEIGNNAFEGCPNLKELNISSNANIGSDAFEASVLRNANLIVRENRDLVLKIMDSGWDQFTKIYYEEESKRYSPIFWNERLECPVAFYSNINGCLISTDCENVIVRIDSDKAMTTIFRGMNISESLKSQNGFSFVPNELWRNNIFELFSNENINNSRNITVTSAGQLFNELGMNNLQVIESLTVTGDLNGTDIMTINRMTSLKYLDLTNANIVEGGVTYHENLKTQNNIFGEYFFRDLQSLMVILMPKTVTEIHSNSVNRSIYSVILPHNVTKIGDYAFSECASLVNIVFPNSIEYIGKSAFCGCASLQSLNIPGDVTVIGDSAFSGCSLISSVVLADGNNTLTIYGNSPLFAESALKDVYLGRNLSYNGISSFHSNSPFKNQSELTKVTIGDNVTIIEKCAFENCTSLSSIQIPNCVKIIDNGAFRGCSSLTSIEISNSVNTLGDYVFDGCTALESIELPNSIVDIGAYAFANCKSLKSIGIPYGVKFICESTFRACIALTSIELPNSILGISDYAFDGCISLRTINLGDNVIQIRKYAFSECSALESIEVPSSVEIIERGAFYNCTSISSVVIKDGDRLLTIGGDNTPFKDCPLKEVYLGRNTAFTANSNSLFNNQEELCNVTIGPFVSKIGNYTFNKCTALKTIEIPNGVIEIGIRAFSDCTSLSKVCIGNSVESIGDSAFGTCTSLESVEIPNSVTEIGWGAFDGCSNMSSLLLGDSISIIGDKAFSGCYALKKVVSLNPTPPAIAESTFDGVDKENCQLVVTKGNLVYYWLDPYWKEFVNISDDLLALNPLPSVKYGDAPVNLANYALEGVTLSYESSDNNVARIDGTMLTICGAGEATVSASVGEDGTPMEIIGQMRTFKVDQADLTITAQSYEITQGDPLPDFTAIYNGFVYDDNANSLKKSPTIVCMATDSSAEGVYDIHVYDAEDPNYNINYVNGQLIIKARAALTSIYDDSNISCIAYNGQILISGLVQSQVVNIYDINGVLCFSECASENGTLIYKPNKKGIYIVTSIRTAQKVIVN